MANPQFWSGSPRDGDRAHRLQGHLARDLAGRARRRGHRHRPAAGDRAVAVRAPAVSRRRIDSRIADVRSRELLARHLREAQPEVLFHLAAQPLVLAGLDDPVTTFQTNVLGVVNLLDAARRLPVAARGRRDHQRQVLPAARPPLRRGRPAGRARSLQRQQGLRRDRRPGLPLLLLPARRRRRRSPRCAPATSSAAATSRPAGCCPTWSAPSPPASPRSCAIPAGVRPWQHVLDALAGYLPAGRAPGRQPGLVLDRLELRPGRGRRVDRGRGSPRSPRSASAAAAGGRPRSDLAIEVPTLLLSSEQARRWLGWRPRLTTEQAVQLGDRRLPGAAARARHALAGRPDPRLRRPCDRVPPGRAEHAGSRAPSACHAYA